MPSAHPLHLLNALDRDYPFSGIAKSIYDVVPPAIAALLPVSKSSIAFVPINGSCICVWVSIPPGMMSLPEQSITYAVLWVIFEPTAVIFPF